MKLVFTCRLPKGRNGATYIGSADITLKDGVHLTIDRSETRYSFSGDALIMDWLGAFIEAKAGTRLYERLRRLPAESIKSIRFSICKGAPEGFFVEPVAMYYG